MTEIVEKTKTIQLLLTYRQPGRICHTLELLVEVVAGERAGSFLREAEGSVQPNLGHKVNEPWLKVVDRAVDGRLSLA